MKERDFQKKAYEFISPYKTEMDMRGLDFLRYDDHLRYIEKWCGIINATDIPTLEMCSNYFAGITILFKLWISLIMIESMRNDLTDKHNDAKKMKREWESVEKYGAGYPDYKKIKLVDLLDELHTTLMILKQQIGMGQPVKRSFTPAGKITYGMGRGKKQDMPPNI